MSNDTCEQIAASLSSGRTLDQAGKQHVEHCPACASLARLPGLIHQFSQNGATSTAVESQPGFHTRTVARASERLFRRRRARVLRTAALTTCAAFVVAFVIGGSAAVWPSVWSSSNTVSATQPTPPVVIQDEAAPGPDILDTRDLSHLTNWSQTDRSLAFRADWRAAGGQVSTEDIARQKRSLGLTAEQEKALRRIIDEQQKQELETRARIEKAKIDLRTQLDSDNPNEITVGKTIERISELEASVRKGRVLSWLQARKLLDPEQRRRLAKPERDALERALDDADKTLMDPQLERTLDEALERAEQQFDNHADVSKEERRRMREEIRRAREQMREELSRARREFERRRPDFEDAMREFEHMRPDFERAQEDALREMERMRQEARPEAERARESDSERDLFEQARREAAEARERAMREAERAHEQVERAREERERALQEAERARERAERTRERAERETEQTRERAEREADER